MPREWPDGWTDEDEADFQREEAELRAWEARRARHPLWHGTSVAAAQRIDAEGLRLGDDGIVSVSESWTTAALFAGSWAWADWDRGRAPEAVMLRLDPKQVLLLEHGQADWPEMERPAVEKERYIALADGRRLDAFDYTAELRVYEPVPSSAVVAREDLRFDFDDLTSRMQARQWYAVGVHDRALLEGKSKEQAARLAGAATTPRRGRAYGRASQSMMGSTLPW